MEAWTRLASLVLNCSVENARLHIGQCSDRQEVLKRLFETANWSSLPQTKKSLSLVSRSLSYEPLGDFVRDKSAYSAGGLDRRTAEGLLRRYVEPANTQAPQKALMKITLRLRDHRTPT